MHRLSVVDCVPALVVSLLVSLALVATLGCSSPPAKPPAGPDRRTSRAAAKPRPRTPPPRARRASHPKPGMVTIKGWSLQVLLVPERTTFMVGEPIFMSFKVHNHSAEDLQIHDGGDHYNRLNRPNGYRVRVRPVGGALLPLRDAGPTNGLRASARRMRPDTGYSRELFLPNWAYISRPGRYEILCTRMLYVSKHHPKKTHLSFSGKGVKHIARVLVTVTSTTPARMGRLIKELGEIVLNKNLVSYDKAARALEAIRDPRIVPYFIKALKRNFYFTNRASPRVFGRFNTDAALAGLKLCKANDSVHVRRICAQSMSVSKIPQAWPLLLSLMNDEDRDVRLIVLSALGKKGCARKILKLIRKMSADDEEKVKEEAKRYLDRCKKKKKRKRR